MALGKQKTIKIKPKQLPAKRTINFAVIGRKKPNILGFLFGLMIIGAGAWAIGKYAVADRLTEMAHRQCIVTELQNAADERRTRLSEFDDISDIYAHYTYEGLTTEELANTNREDLLKMLDHVVYPNSIVQSWSVSGNILSLPVVSETLQEINELTQLLNNEPLVDYCTVTTAISETEQVIVLSDILDSASAVPSDDAEGGQELAMKEEETEISVEENVTGDLILEEMENVGEPEAENAESELLEQDFAKPEEREPQTELQIREIVTGQITVYLKTTVTEKDLMMLGGGY